MNAAPDAIAAALEMLTMDRCAAFALVIRRLVGPVRFGGPIPIPDFRAWAALAMEIGFDPSWAADWIRGGYPEPPPYLRPPAEMSPAELNCPHPRQMTAERDSLPCAYPKCWANRSAAQRWVTVVMKPMRFWQGPDPTPSSPVDHIVWERIEYRDAGGRAHFFWRQTT